MTTNTGTPCYDADFPPYGQERAYTSTCPTPNAYKFEGKERDTETQNDDFGARYYSWRFGRWLSADWSAVPVAVPYANLTNPQTLNLYAMVADDPETFADLDGHDGGNTCGGVEFTPCSQKADSDQKISLTENNITLPQNIEPCYQCGHWAQNNQQAGGNQPPPTNPDGSPKAPPSDVPKPPPGKPPGWKPGDPLAPNDWAPGKGTGDRPTRWDPKYPVPGQSQPTVSWGPEGHWDYIDGFGNRTRYGPNGGQVDHDNNPTMMDRMRSITPGPILKWGTVGVVGFIIIDEGSRFVFPLRNLVPVP